MQTPYQNAVLAAPDGEADNSCAARNNVACSANRAPRRKRFRNPSGTSDSKHSDAAALAVDLASSSSWSEAFSPPAAPIKGDMSDNSTNSQRLDYSRNQVAPDNTDLGPPPEYSSSYEHDLTSDSDHSQSEDMRHSSSRREIAPSTHLGYGVQESDHRPDVDAPLLGEASQKVPDGDYPSRQINGSASLRKYRLRWLHAVVGFVVLFIAGGVLGYFHVGRQNMSSQRILPQVPTDKVHIQHETYKDIRGRFQLHDRLELSTTTGVIDIEIDLQSGNGTAELILSSSTGAIKLGVSDTWWYRGDERSTRPVHTEIKTVTGSVYGRILLGQGGYACVDSVTGAQDIRVYVFDAGPDDETAELITRSHVGDQVVAVTHFGAWDATISSLKAKHHSLGTASLDLQYSHAWRGEVHAVSSSVGHLEVQGDVGLVFDKQQAHEVVAHKGRDDTHRKTIDVVSDGTGSACFKSWYTW